MERERLSIVQLTTFYPPHNFGGDGIHVQRLSRALARRGHQVRVVHAPAAYAVLGVNNPIGGMGMNGGIHDAINLSGKIAQALDGTGGEDVLDLYSRQRRFAAVEYVQAQTIANKKLLEEKDLNVRRKNLMQLRSTADDLEKTKAFMRRTSLLESVRSSEAVT